MTNVQQPEMRRNENNPTVQDSKRPGPVGGRPRAGRGRARPVPPAQSSPYGPEPRAGRAGDKGEHD
ncbi:hypothetical protein [Micromonospora zhanjiangensis]|uniref:Uncharacterized protein n=1 Tax=Micromonospora zhanjiangensis TaxID=1522057 RepID=A0ABV8KVC0_9ACTN